MEQIKGYLEHKKREYMKKYKIDDLEKYFSDIDNIENTITGRMDIYEPNTFIMEAVKLIINSMTLFEEGYFDAAYYSLRQSIEISMTVVYLADIPDEEKNIKIEAWRDIQEFPMQSKMLKKLYNSGSVVRDMKEKMNDFFNETENVNKSLNKYVHKQGFKNFYVSRNHPANHKKSDEIFIKNYIYYLEKTIGIVAIMRLAIDPYPILLMDEEILFRCFDSMTEPYSNEFVEKYISKDTLSCYKNTQIYLNHYNWHIQYPKKNIHIFEIMKYQFIDTEKKCEILSQINLLDEIDKYVTYICFSSSKVMKVYVNGIFQMYFTNRNTNRKSNS